MTSGAKTIVSARPHAPPRGSTASATGRGTPLGHATFMSRPAAKKPSDELSADQNGCLAPSVAAIGRASREPRSRRTSGCRWRPCRRKRCGDRSVRPPGAESKVMPSGNAHVNRVASGAPVCGGSRSSQAAAIAVAANAGTASQTSRRGSRARTACLPSAVRCTLASAVVDACASDQARSAAD